MDDLNRSKIPAPFETDRVSVRPEWVDYNGHMNVGYYPVAFDNAFEEAYDFLGVGGEAIKRTGISTFVAEAHFTYQQELRSGQRLRITTQLLDFDAKRMQVFQAMYHAAEGFLAATAEWLILCVDLRQRKVIAMPEHLRDLVARVHARHAGLTRPPEVGRNVSLTSRRPR
jgi:acyl-CoA thioester hydrolase